jgi:[ribosomal protein S5]-alanine N-acetyltransferase
MGKTSAGTDVVFETARLVLLRLKPGDLDALAAIQRDPETMRFLGGPRSRARSSETLGWIMEAEREHGYGLWATTLRADGKLIGRCGLLVQEVDGAAEHEIAYLLGRDWWGSGYATEAAGAIRDHARSQLGLDRLISLIAPANVASMAVAKRIGMLHERDLTFEGRPTSLFALQNRGQTPILHARP